VGQINSEFIKEPQFQQPQQQPAAILRTARVVTYQIYAANVKQDLIYQQMSLTTLVIVATITPSAQHQDFVFRVLPRTAINVT